MNTDGLTRISLMNAKTPGTLILASRSCVPSSLWLDSGHRPDSTTASGVASSLPPCAEAALWRAAKVDGSTVEPQAQHYITSVGSNPSTLNAKPSSHFRGRRPGKLGYGFLDEGSARMQCVCAEAAG